MAGERCGPVGAALAAKLLRQPLFAGKPAPTKAEPIYNS